MYFYFRFYICKADYITILKKMSKILTSFIKTCTSSTSNNFADKIL